MGVRLAAFNLPSIAKLTMTDELHLQELGERKIALFCCIPDSDKSLNYLVGMIYTQLIQTLYRQADRIHKGRLPVPVHCLMDEYANISLPKDTFLSALATMRSRAIFCSIIVQNMAQLKAMYKDDWESLVGLCDEFALPAFAASDPLVVVENLSTFIFSLIRAVGLILLGWGIVQVGLSLQSHDPSQRSQGFLTLAGGLVITFAKEILDLITA